MSLNEQIINMLDVFKRTKLILNLIWQLEILKGNDDSTMNDEAFYSPPNFLDARMMTFWCKVIDFRKHVPIHEQPPPVPSNQRHQKVSPGDVTTWGEYFVKLWKADGKSSQLLLGVQFANQEYLSSNSPALTLFKKVRALIFFLIRKITSLNFFTKFSLIL